MDEYYITIINPITCATLEAQINPDITADEVINALVSENFIEAPDNIDYQNEVFINAITGGLLDAYNDQYDEMMREYKEEFD